MTLEAYVQGFGCVPDPASYDAARLALLPVPLDWGYGELPGVALGPMAVLGASRFIETYDAHLGLDPLDAGVVTLDAISFSYESEQRPHQQIRDKVTALLADGKFPLCLGGDRTVVAPTAAAAAAHHGSLGVVSLTRRPGLRDVDKGRRLSPATIGRRLCERHPTAMLGPRFWSVDDERARQELELAAFVTASQLGRQPLAPETLDRLPSKVHLSIDVGVLDPAFLPMAGNVEPGGLSWFALTDLIDLVFATKQVVSCDVAGFVPTMGQIAGSVLVAQLVLRCLGRASVR